MRRVLPLSDHLISRSTEQGSCLVWQGARDPKGYGMISINSRPKRVHIVAYEITNGPVAKGLLVRHTCDNPPCWRLEHLLVGTSGDNFDDMIARDRHPFIKARATPRPPRAVRICKIKRSVNLGADMWKYLEKEARRQGTTVSAVLRQATREYMERKQAAEAAESSILPGVPVS